VGLALSGRALLPTATVRGPLGTGAGFEVDALFDVGVGSRGLLVVNLGHRAVPGATLNGLVIDDALTMRVGGSYALTDAVSASFEVASTSSYRSFLHREVLPVEAMLGGRAKVAAEWQAHAGLGTAVTPGFGGARLRLVAGATFRPGHDEAAPVVVHPPAPPPVAPLIPVPVPEPEPIVVAPPPPPEAPASRVTVTQSRIELDDHVNFDSGRSTLAASSHDLLDEVADLLVAHPELVRVRIEGHTDLVGSAAANQTLSQDRAEAVRTYLMNAGVDADRMEALGYGVSQPVAEGSSHEANQANRRVEIVVLERRDDGDATATTD